MAWFLLWLVGQFLTFSMLRVSIVLSLFILSSSVFSQTLVIKNENNMTPIPFVNVYSKNQKFGAVSNGNGEVDVSKFLGVDSIIINSINYIEHKTTYLDLQKQNWLVLLSPKSYGFAPVIISANKWQQNSGDIPNNITKIPQEEVDLINPQTAADVLGVANGVFIQKSQQGGGSPMIRGFSSNRLLYSIDGVRMNNAIFRSGNLHNVISLDPHSMGSTEVLFGPGSVIYGSDAIGGVMSFTSLTPKFSKDSFKIVSGNYFSRISSANKELTNHLDINIGNKKWSFLTSSTFSNYQSTVMGKHGPDEYLNNSFPTFFEGEDYLAISKSPRKQTPSGYSQFNFMQKVSYQLQEKLTINYAFHFSETSDIPRYDRLIQTNNSLPRYAEWYYGPQRWVMNQMTVVDERETRLYDQAIANIAFQQFKESRHNRRFNSAFRNNNAEQVNAYSVNFDFLKKVSIKNTLSYGLEGIQNEVKSEGNIEEVFTREKTESNSRYPYSTWNSIAAYATNSYEINSKLNIVGGFRYNLYSLKSEFDTSLFPYPITSASLRKSALSGSLGFVYKQSESFHITSNISTGFRAPNVDDIGKVFDSEPGAVIVPNPNLKAEFVYNYELGFSKSFKNRLKFSLTIYYTELKNAMVRRDFDLNGQDSILYEGEISKVQAIQNAASSYVYGFESGVELKLNSNFKFSSEVSYQKGEEELDNGDKSPSRHVAPIFGRSSLYYKKQNLSLVLNATYTGEISNKNLNIGERNKPYLYAFDSRGLPYSPSWYTLNLNANYRFKKNIKLSGGIQNITNQRYRTYSSGIASPGRNYLLSIKFSL